MAVINIPGQEPWFAARWAFEQLLDRTEGKVANHPELIRELEQAKALDGLHLDMKPLIDQERLIPALAHAARDLANELERQPQDKLGQSFIDGLRELDRMLGAPF